MEYTPTIGLEIHVELKTRTKMFCASLNDPDEKRPNTNICPICMGHPGTLPVANEEAIRKVVLAGMSLGCTIDPETFFERKNYFYPDLPKGYQITQYQRPFCKDGILTISDAEGKSKTIRIERIHLEEDVGRSYHSADGSDTLLDFNRAGVPLMELVTKPDFTSAEEVVAFAEELRLILRYAGVSDADMEKGQMRVEVNISMAPSDAPGTGTKVEVKNINSINAAGRAAVYEMERQANVLRSGERVIQETRGWDEMQGLTVSQRIKEGAADYRYFPEPDLPPIVLTPEWLADVQIRVPELPAERRARFAKEYALPEHDIEVMTINRSLGDYFEHVASELGSFEKLSHLDRPSVEHVPRLYKLASNYLMTELARHLDATGLAISQCPISPEHFADAIVRVFHGEVSSSGAQALIAGMFVSRTSPEDVIREKDLAQVSDSSTLLEIVQKVLAENEKAVADYRAGKEAPLKFLVGKVMAASKGKANPQVAQELILKALQ
ncbi:MAG: Asp-tRNA(Asn)/Glu-tRNA(Gln) amidotransferase subunit GatB [Patescibacteria group bacterium]